MLRQQPWQSLHRANQPEPSGQQLQPLLRLKGAIVGAEPVRHQKRIINRALRLVGLFAGLSHMLLASPLSLGLHQLSSAAGARKQPLLG